MTCIIIHSHVHSADRIRALRHLQTLTKPYNLLTLGKQGQREVKSVILTALCRAGQGTCSVLTPCRLWGAHSLCRVANAPHNVANALHRMASAPHSSIWSKSGLQDWENVSGSPRNHGDLPKLTHISLPSLPDSSTGLGIGYARSEQALVAQQKYKSSLKLFQRGQ